MTAEKVAAGTVKFDMSLHPGLYVVRYPYRGAGSRLIIESRCFQLHDDKESIPDDWVRQQAQHWADFVQSQHPKDDVFVIERN